MAVSCLGAGLEVEADFRRQRSGGDIVRATKGGKEIVKRSFVSQVDGRVLLRWRLEIWRLRQPTKGLSALERNHNGYFWIMQTVERGNENRGRKTLGGLLLRTAGRIPPLK
jgi:hypothetical protein